MGADCRDNRLSAGHAQHRVHGGRSHRYRTAGSRLGFWARRGHGLGCWTACGLGFVDLTLALWGREPDSLALMCWVSGFCSDARAAAT